MREALISALGDEERLRKTEVATFLTRCPKDALEDPVTFARAVIAAGKVGARIAEILPKIDFDIYSKEVENLRRSGVKLVSILDSEYPRAFWELEDPPLMLYVRGSLPTRRCAAVVGTRGISAEGAAITSEIVARIAGEGLGVISGLAKGTDTVAHETALHQNAFTCAILPGGPLQIVPRENAALAREILESGGLISEVTDLKPVHKGRFIQRNRLTSALSDFVVAIESGVEGGTTHQVKFALEQRKPVFVWSGTPRSEFRAGPLNRVSHW